MGPFLFSWHLRVGGIARLCFALVRLRCVLGCECLFSMKQVASFGWGQKGKEKKRKERKKKKAKRLSQRRRIQKEQKEKERGKGMERKKVLAVHQEWKCVQQTNKATTNVSDEKKKKRG